MIQSLSGSVKSFGVLRQGSSLGRTIEFCAWSESSKGQAVALFESLQILSAGHVRMGQWLGLCVRLIHERVVALRCYILEYATQAMQLRTKGYELCRSNDRFVSWECQLFLLAISSIVPYSFAVIMLCLIARREKCKRVFSFVCYGTAVLYSSRYFEFRNYVFWVMCVWWII